MSVVPRFVPCLALAVLSTGCVVATENPAATPQRPLFSNNTQTTVPGSMEVEVGGEFDRYDRSEIPLGLKFGLSEGVEAFVQHSPYRHVRPGGGVKDLRGRSDTLVGTRYRFFEDETDGTSAAVQLSASVPTGSSKEGFSTEEYDWYLAAIYAGLFDGWAWTTFYELGKTGEFMGSGFDTTHGVAFAAAHNIGGDTDFFAEIAGLHDRVRSFYPIFATVGIRFAEQPTRVWDVGVQMPVNDDAGDAVIKAGVTYNMSRSGSSGAPVGN